jgi:hypothetical protein
MAVWINSDCSEDEIFELVFAWIDVLAQGDYEQVAKELGYWNFDVSGATKAIREAIHEYRSPNLFPTITDFRVTDWRLVVGGNPEPAQKIAWYNENSVGIVASVCIDLPLNGAWSDLAAEFLLFERGDRPGQYQLRLEEMSHPLRDDEAGSLGQ